MTTTPAHRSDSEASHEQVERELQDATTHLQEHFPLFGREAILAVVRESYTALEDGATVHQHLVTLAEHRAWLRLDALSQPHM